MKKRKKIIFIITVIVILFFAKKAEAAQIDITVNFVDENLKNAILELAKNATGDKEKTKIYESDIEKIVSQSGGTSLKLANKGIKDLSGIEAFANKGITWIFLDWNEISDLSPLKEFSQLTKISFSGNQVNDLTSLSNLENLENIIAVNNRITTLDTIKNLQNVKYICLDGNNLNNINAIENWSNLNKISFQRNQIVQLPNLSKLTKLENINVCNNQIQTINNIPKIATLEKLEIDNNLLTSLEGIQNFSNLKILSCSNNKLTQIAELEKLSKLENLNINKNNIQDISKLQKNTQIQYVYIDDNIILNFDTLKQLPNLQKYSIYNQTVNVEIKEKLTGDNIVIPLPTLYTQLYDKNSYIHQDNLTTEVTGASTYKVDSSNKNITLKSNELKKGNISIRVYDDTNTFLTYTMQADTTAPVIEGIVNNKKYLEQAVTPICDDDDVTDVQLTKNGIKVVYTLGNTIKEAGKYILRVSDKAGNQSTVTFELQDETIESSSYKVDSKYVIGINQKTSLTEFKKLLKTNTKYDVYRENHKLSDKDIIISGDKLITEYNKNRTLIVKGDITKDGKTNISDLVLLRKYILKLQEFDEIELKSADITQDNKANISDLVEIRKIILGIN